MMPRAGLFLFALFWLAADATPAFAYIDPGAGSLLQQGLAALLASGAVLMFSLRERFAQLIGRRKSEPENAGTAKD